MVAEKPSVAKLIAEFLSGGRMRFRKGQQRIPRIYDLKWPFGVDCADFEWLDLNKFM